MLIKKHIKNFCVSEFPEIHRMVEYLELQGTHKDHRGPISVIKVNCICRVGSWENCQVV